jgi:hypothetical protein
MSNISSRFKSNPSSSSFSSGSAKRLVVRVRGVISLATDVETPRENVAGVENAAAHETMERTARVSFMMTILLRVITVTDIRDVGSATLEEETMRSSTRSQSERVGRRKEDDADDADDARPSFVV